MRSTVSSTVFKNKRVVVLGATGRLGTVLRGFWPSGGVSWQSRHAGDGLQSVDILNDPKGLSTLLESADSVLCLAGTLRGDANTLHQNTDLALAAIGAAPAAARVFLASSAAVYGQGGPDLCETGECVPQSPYGQAKLEMENTALDSGHQVTSLRIGNVAGCDAILGGWRAGMTIDADANGHTPRRSYIGPQALARVLADVVTTPNPPAILNISAPGSVEMGTLLDAAGLAYAPRKPEGCVIWDVTLNTERLEKLTQFSPDNSTATGIIDDWHGAKGFL